MCLGPSGGSRGGPSHPRQQRGPPLSGLSPQPCCEPGKGTQCLLPCRQGQGMAKGQRWAETAGIHRCPRVCDSAARRPRHPGQPGPRAQLPTPPSFSGLILASGGAESKPWGSGEPRASGRAQGVAPVQTSSGNRISFAFWPFGPIWDCGGFVGRDGELRGRGVAGNGAQGSQRGGPHPRRVPPLAFPGCPPAERGPCPALLPQGQ